MSPADTPAPETLDPDDPRAQFLTVDWQVPTRARWDAMLAACRGATLTQSAPYTLALAATGPMRADFGLIRFEGRPIGFVVAHGRRRFGAPGNQTIYRGPLFVHEEMPREMQGLVLSQLRARFRLRRGRPVAFHPELPDTPEHRALMQRSGFRRVAEGYRTIVLDLAPDLDALRAGLSGSWRNALVQGERAGLTVSDTRDGAGLDWLIERHGEHMALGGYRGPSGPLLQALQAAGNDTAHIRLLRALADGEAVSGVLLARHGDSVTWLVGWTGEEGRRLRATNLLLWHAVAIAKAEGLRRFDLGGINAEAPGVAAFKAGMGGQELVLVGGYV